MPRRLIALLVALGVAASAHTAAAGSPKQDAADARLDRALARLVAMQNGPPGAIAVVQRGNELRVHSFGVAELGTKRRLRVNDHLRIASVAKAFSGAAALALVQAGVLSLDDTI